MTIGRNTLRRWSNWTLKVRAWKLLVVLIIASVLALWFMVVHQNDEILALARSDVVTDSTGQRTWKGSFVNTNDRTLRDVAVSVDFLDSHDLTVGRAGAETAELPFGSRLDLQAILPADAARLRIYSVQWRMGRKAALMGPFREPWEFGYVMVDPATMNP